MDSLGDAYTGSRWDGRDPRRVVAGGVLAVLGLLAVLAGVLVVTTSIGELFGRTTVEEAQQLGGVLAGLGIPALLLGVVVVLPSSLKERMGVLGGATLCVVGVALFRVAYPGRWTGAPDSIAFHTTTIYVVGGAIAFWFVLTTIADFRTRNNPHGTITLELIKQGKTRTVEVSPDEYQRYRNAVRSDGGETEQVIQELEERFGD